MKVRGHFSKKGWSTVKDEFDIIKFDSCQLEAIELIDEENKIQVSALIDEEWEEQNQTGVVGSTGKGQKIRGLSFNITDNYKQIYYRICTNDNDWSKIFHDGKKFTIKDEKDFITGFQIFTCKKNKLDYSKKQATALLENYEKLSDKLFLYDKEKMLEKLNRSYNNLEKTNITQVKEGFILPLKSISKASRSGTYAGGVCDKNRKFVTGLERGTENYSCTKAYDFDEFNEIDETIIFGGIFIKTFGHLFGECLSRLWYFVENKNVTQKIAILTIPGQSMITYEFFELLGINTDNIIVIEKPTKFKNIIVPDQTICLWKWYKDKYITIYDEIRQQVKASKYKKIYLTRHLFTDNDGINEEFFVNIFKKNGFEIIAPEQHSLKEQISYIAGADEIVCTEGTLSHLALFAKSNTKLTIIRRDHKNFLVPQFIINEARKLDVFYVDATFNLLPVRHAGGVFLYGPTPEFLAYLDYNKIKYTKNDIKFEIKDYCSDYLEKWLEHYTQKRNFDGIINDDIIDVVNSLAIAFGKKQIKISEYKSKSKLLKENKKQQERIDILTKKPSISDRFKRRIKRIIKKIMQDKKI